MSAKLFGFILVGIFLISALVYQAQNLFLGISEDAPLGNMVRLLPTASPSLQPSPLVLPLRYEIPLRTHVFQSFNNCGPASLSMLLSYLNLSITQQELGQKLRPYQHPTGDNDDKSVTLEELAQEGESYGFVAIHRPNGDPRILKSFIANNIPVILRTWLKPEEDIGHYRLVRGYDDSTQEFIQDDSLQNKNLRYTYSELNTIWKPFNFEYLVLIPPEKLSLAKTILGDEMDTKVAWTNTKNRIKRELTSDPQNMYSLFNLSIASYHLGEYQAATTYFEQVENRLPMRMLWYQIEPIEAYYQVKNYPRVFEITDKILNNHNRAFSELYYLRGLIYKEEGNIEAARSEFERAVLYNRNYTPAQEALREI